MQSNGTPLERDCMENKTKANNLKGGRGCLREIFREENWKMAYLLHLEANDYTWKPSVRYRQKLSICLSLSSPCFSLSTLPSERGPRMESKPYNFDALGHPFSHGEYTISVKKGLRPIRIGIYRFQKAPRSVDATSPFLMWRRRRAQRVYFLNEEPDRYVSSDK